MRFTDEDAIEMRERWRRGESIAAIADRFDTKWTTARNAIEGRTYKGAPCPVTPSERVIWMRDGRS